MVNKLNPKLQPKHNATHKEYYEKKLEMVICGCGNRRLLTDNEALQYGLVVNDMQLMNVMQIPKRR